MPVRSGGVGNDKMPEKMLESYITGVVEPLQVDIEAIWSDKIFAEGLGCPNYEIAFTDIDTKDETIEIEQDNSRIRHGWMTPNQARIKRGDDPYPSGDSYYMDAALMSIGEDPYADSE